MKIVSDFETFLEIKVHVFQVNWRIKVILEVFFFKKESIFKQNI